MDSASDRAPGHLSAAAGLMREVYGDWLSEGWAPSPLPRHEAGEHPTGQRRYLWVDAFGVLNFVSLAEQAEGEAARAHLRAAERLIDAVHSCLGSPRSAELPMREAPDGGHEGLRIGKVEARRTSDPGMRLDGMYWHYLDKWIFALARYARAARDASAVLRGLRLVRQVHPRFLARTPQGQPLGLFWKMNADLTTIPGRERAGPSGDAVAGLVAYTALQRTLEALGPTDEPGIVQECSDLLAVSRAYAAAGGLDAGTSDPLGYGLQHWEAQFFAPELTRGLRRELHGLAGAALHPRHLSLPFRLYGGLLGARLSGEPKLQAVAAERLEQVLPEELRTRCGETEHSGINKVMLASALMPTAFERRADEETISL